MANQDTQKRFDSFIPALPFVIAVVAIPAEYAIYRAHSGVAFPTVSLAAACVALATGLSLNRRRRAALAERERLTAQLNRAEEEWRRSRERLDRETADRMEGELVQQRFAALLEDRTRLTALIQEQSAVQEEREAEVEQLREQLAEVYILLAQANLNLDAGDTTDRLTGLKNHRAFQERLAEEYHRSVQSGRPLSLLLIDVDQFKQYNDAFGYPAGDEVLRTAAALLGEVVSDSDLAARYGGEEFVVILPDMSAESAMEAAERLRKKVEGNAWLQRQVTVSIGVATLTEEMVDLSLLLSEAGRALCRSKERGGNRVTHAHDVEDLDALRDNIRQAYTQILQEILAKQNDVLASAPDQIKQSMVAAYSAAIESWGRILDVKDREPEGHNSRVTQMTVQLARSMGMSEEELLYIRWGALLHDIGKMGVPDAILLKPGPLTNDEWEVMRRHPAIAHEMLLPIPFLRPAVDIPYCHHEKWDGAGYPRGLKGEEIPLAARLFAVVDVYDSLRCDRPYRKGWPKQKVLDYLQEQAGAHFDPHVVRAFMRMLHQDRGLLVAEKRQAA